MWDDLRFTFRTLARAPLFTFTAIAAMALGIGSTAAIFSVINGVLLVEGETSGDYRLGEGRLVLDEVQPGRVRVTQGGASRELTLGAPAETVAPPGGGD